MTLHNAQFELNAGDTTSQEVNEILKFVHVNENSWLFINWSQAKGVNEVLFASMKLSILNTLPWPSKGFYSFVLAKSLKHSWTQNSFSAIPRILL